MNTEPGNREILTNGEEAEAVADEEFTETTVLPESTNTDNIGDVSVEINVEELVAEIEAAQDDESAKRAEARRRLDAIRDEQEAAKELEDTYAIDMNEE